MAGTRTPSATRFVVRGAGKDPEEIRRRTKDLGSCQELEESSDLTVVEVETHADGPKAAWEKLKTALGPEHEVAPVLLDEEGGEHYPTGKLTVRFRETPSDEELARFAADHGLQLRGRNKWVAMQADFEASREAEDFLPELVEKVEEEKTVRAAWPDTLSRYRRL